MCNGHGGFGTGMVVFGSSSLVTVIVKCATVMAVLKRAWWFLEVQVCEGHGQVCNGHGDFVTDMVFLEVEVL